MYVGSLIVAQVGLVLIDILFPEVVINILSESYPLLAKHPNEQLINSHQYHTKRAKRK